LIVTQTPENQRNLVKLLEQLRETRAIQVTIETRFLKIQRNFLEDIGVDFDFQFNGLDSRIIGNNITGGLKRGAIGFNQGSSEFTSVLGLDATLPGNLSTQLSGGPGIDAGILPRVFELFVQGARTDDRARTGVGIGLALARHLVSLHGGTIEARNLPQRGSELTVRLPSIAAPEEEGTTNGLDGLVQARRVLVVDDNLDAAQAVGKVLALLGHQVDIVGSAQEALEIARRTLPEVVFLDELPRNPTGKVLKRELRDSYKT
jgi:CheY-like chemotaxis protein